MNIFISDEDRRLSSEFAELMQKAGDAALDYMFGDMEAELGCRASELPVDLSVSVMNYEEIRELNSEYRGIDKVTDVLSFPQFANLDELRAELGDFAQADESEAADSEEYEEYTDDDFLQVLLGDVVICYDRACEQAEEYGTGIRRELIYLFVHSIFHLLGFDHETEEEKTEMRRHEEAVLDLIGAGREGR